MLGNLVGLALAVYKCQVMGLLPTHPSDWLAFVEPQQVMLSPSGLLVFCLNSRSAAHSVVKLAL